MLRDSLKCSTSYKSGVDLKLEHAFRSGLSSFQILSVLLGHSSILSDNAVARDALSHTRSVCSM